MKITCNRPQRKLWISFESYFERIAAKFHLDTRGAPRTPMTLQHLEPYEGTATAADIHLFQKLIGSAIYPTVLLRLDKAYPANRLSRYLQNPSPEHRSATYRVLEYLVSTKQRGILFDGEYQGPKMEVFTDASFADDSTDRKSSQGYMIILYGTPIVWKASKQPTVTTSSTEAELLALTEANKEAIVTMQLFASIRFHLYKDLIIWYDNKQTIYLITADIPRLCTALRHIDIYNAWARQEVQKGTFKVQYLETDKMPADGFTKVLLKAKLDQFIRQCNLVDVPDAPILTPTF